LNRFCQYYRLEKRGIARMQAVPENSNRLNARGWGLLAIIFDPDRPSDGFKRATGKTGKAGALIYLDLIGV
jgi:hypothetical protein